MKDIQSECDDVWIKIDLFGSKPLLIRAYYKPHEHELGGFFKITVQSSQTQILLKLSLYQLVIPIFLISSLQQIRLLCNELVSFRV